MSTWINTVWSWCAVDSAASQWEHSSQSHTITLERLCCRQPGRFHIDRVSKQKTQETEALWTGRLLAAGGQRSVKAKAQGCACQRIPRRREQVHFTARIRQSSCRGAFGHQRVQIQDFVRNWRIFLTQQHIRGWVAAKRSFLFVHNHAKWQQCVQNC